MLLLRKGGGSLGAFDVTGIPVETDDDSPEGSETLTSSTSVSKCSTITYLGALLAESGLGPLTDDITFKPDDEPGLIFLVCSVAT